MATAEKELFIGVIYFFSVEKPHFWVRLMRTDDRDQAESDLARIAKDMYPATELYESLEICVKPITRTLLRAFIEGDASILDLDQIG